MRKLLLAFALAAAPLGIAAPLLITPTYAAVTITGLGDLSSFQAIVADVLDIAKTGDLGAASKRITDFESAWDDAAGTLRPLSTDKWTTIDHAADAALAALRVPAPDAATATGSLSSLLATLENPGGAAVPVATPVAFAVTNADGSPVPCEVTLKELRTVLSTATPSDADKAKLDELQNKGIERCNADDDKRADGLFSQALAILGH